jgi:glycosyltransferase involved in cell wall biosynthesis
VFSGRLIDIKRADLAIAAFVSIAECRPDWDLLVVGDGPRRASLEAAVPTHLADRVIWTGFLDDQVTMSALYRASDVLVIPSDKEPWALVVNEAVAAGLAVVSSNVVGAAAELVRDGVNGRIFPAGDCLALVTCLLDVTDATQICDMKAGSSRRLADWRRVADPIHGLRRALMNSRVLPSSNAS